MGKAAGRMMYQTQWSIQGDEVSIVHNMNKGDRKQMTGNNLKDMRYETCTYINPVPTVARRRK